MGLPLGEYTVSVVDPTSGPLAGTKPTESTPAAKQDDQRTSLRDGAYH